MTDVSSQHYERWVDDQVGVLGSVIKNSSWAGLVISRTEPDDYCDAYRPIFNAIREKFLSGDPIDLVTIRGKMPDEFGALLKQMLELTPTAANCEAYLDQMLDEGRLLKLAEIGESLQEARSAEEADDLLNSANKLAVRKEKAVVVTMKEALKGFYERQQAAPVEYLTWGIDALDKRIYVEQGDLVILGGYPSDGKTALALSMAYGQAKTKRVGFYSLETKTSKLFDRLIPTLTQADFSRLKHQKLNDDEWTAVAQKAGEITSSKLELIQASGMTVADIRALAQSCRQEIVYIDYLQLIKPSDSRRTAFEQVTQISMDLHNLAQSTGITVVALSQLSRPEKESGKPKAPSMSALRQSGQIEQDADVIMLLYREDPKAMQSKRLLKVAKNKEGESGGVLRLNFDGSTQTFRVDRNDPAIWRQQPRELPDESVPWDTWEGRV